MLCLLAVLPQTASAIPSGNVLVLYSSNRLLPANIEFDQSMMQVLGERHDVNATVFSEFLDVQIFHGAAYERTFATFLNAKFASRPPSVIVAGGLEAFAFVVRQGKELFPHTPVVFVAVPEQALRRMGPLPPEYVGVPMRHDFIGTIEQGLKWRPKARHLLIVLGAGEWTNEWTRLLRMEAPALEGRLDIEFMVVESAAALRSRLQGLSDDWLVFTPGYFVDRQGGRSVPRDAAQLMASASPVPVLGPYESFMGTGVLGGRMVSFSQMGHTAARLSADLISGVPVESLAPPESVPLPLQVDWRQAQRFGISDAELPPGTIVKFKEPSFWQQYRDLALAGIAVMLVQAILIGALLVERRRRRRTAAALSESEHGMKLAAQAARLSMWVLDTQGADARPVLPMRRSTDDALRRFADFDTVLAGVHPADRATVEAAVANARAGEGQLDVEFRQVGDDGEQRWVAARGHTEPGRGQRMLGVAMDITERKQAELQATQDRSALRHITRVSLLGQLSASIAHQLNQPLASILGNAEAARLMLDRHPLDLAELRLICDDIAASDQRAADVIRQLGALFKRTELELVALDLNVLVRDSLELIRGDLLTRGVSVRTHLLSGVPVVAGDRVQLQQLILNLMTNAADAMQGNPEDRRQMIVSTVLRDSMVQLCVADSGHGIAASDMQSIFEPFWTSKVNGMGMGLAICHSVAVAHHGSLTVATAAQGGAVFCLQLPPATT